jgi:hypothetical protein
MAIRVHAVSDDELQRAREASANSWSIGNRVLYDLCQTYPGHDNVRAVVAKVWLIGRSYSAAIERHCKPLPSGAPTDALYTRVAHLLKSSTLDSALRSLKKSGPHTETDLRVPVEIHYQMLRTLKPLTHRSPRSFASKYLHFHAPAWFFIYDSIASRGLRRLLGRRRRSRLLRSIGDREYAHFVAGAWILRGDLVARGASLSMRELDIILLAHGA